MATHEFVSGSDMTELEELLDELLDLDHGLSSWELDFIQKLSEWDGCYTQSQAEALIKLHGRHF